MRYKNENMSADTTVLVQVTLDAEICAAISKRPQYANMPEWWYSLGALLTCQLELASFDVMNTDYSPKDGEFSITMEDENTTAKEAQNRALRVIKGVLKEL